MKKRDLRFAAIPLSANAGYGLKAEFAFDIRQFFEVPDPEVSA